MSSVFGSRNWYDFTHEVQDGECIELYYEYEYCGGGCELYFRNLQKAHNHLHMIHHPGISHPGRWVICVVKKDTKELVRRLQSFDWKYDGYSEYSDD